MTSKLYYLSMENIINKVFYIIKQIFAQKTRCFIILVTKLSMQVSLPLEGSIDLKHHIGL